MQKQIFTPRFSKGDQVEVFKQKTNSFYPAIVLRELVKPKNLVFVEYQTLFSSSEDDLPEPSKLRRGFTNVSNVRPKAPRDLILCYKIGDCVEGFRENAWCPGTIREIRENSKYLVAFDGGKKEIAEFEQCSLRRHRKWVNGSWVPPISEQEKPPDLEMETNPGESRFKIKYSRKIRVAKFKKGMVLEVTSDEEGYQGAWFIATIVDSIGNDRFLVEYRDLTTDDGSQLLKEEVDARHVKPCPPQVPSVVSFKQFQEVDAWYNDGWWEGIVLKILDGRKYYVHFMPSNEVIEFEMSKLRPHHNWVNGKWVMSSEKSILLTEKPGDVMLQTEDTGKKLIFKLKGSKELAKKRSGDVMSKTNGTGKKVIIKFEGSNELAKKSRDVMSKTKDTGNVSRVPFYKGTKVEVRSDEEGYQGAWYAAVIVDLMPNGKYLVEYETLKTDDLTEQLKEEAEASDIRPYPPETNHLHPYAQYEKVDSWYNDGWWVGQVVKVLRGLKYLVYFLPTNEMLEYEHSDLRPHQEWIDGKWMIPP
ncbi:hypothetical protein L6164_011938 [Bauhinia variegata]|uniref:Uncharacterized protein n=1 Tax=Bauhinia variegata TaxID=167791 RepID=A0ACB9P9Q2_BAUVA|nr:hypothetical protein L6164_011938 [Bauhinia variegata]